MPRENYATPTYQQVKAMGKQQMLLLVLAIVIVGIAIAAGIEAQIQQRQARVYVACMDRLNAERLNVYEPDGKDAAEHERLHLVCMTEAGAN